MERVKVLDNINSESISRMIPCFKPVIKRYEKDTTIITYHSDVPSSLAILTKGTASLEVIGEKGNIFLLESYKDGDVFGELFSLPLDNFEYLVKAKTECVVTYLDYHHITKPCHNLCDHHSQLISNLFLMAAQRSQELSLHISILGQSSIRGKLLTYLSYLNNSLQKNKDGTFSIPMSLSQLAEYLVVDRSSMMREISSMKKAGILYSKNRQFKILK